MNGLMSNSNHFFFICQLAVIRQVLRKELGLKIVEVSSAEKAHVEGSDVLWTGVKQTSI